MMALESVARFDDAKTSYGSLRVKADSIRVDRVRAQIEDKVSSMIRRTLNG
jgi:hypothetical protein